MIGVPLPKLSIAVDIKAEGYIRFDPGLIDPLPIAERFAATVRDDYLVLIVESPDEGWAQMRRIYEAVVEAETQAKLAIQSETP